MTGRRVRRSLAIRAFTQRAWIQQGAALLLFSIGIGAGVGFLTCLVGPGANALSGADGLIPAGVAELATVRDSAGAVLPVASFVFSLTPILLGSLVSIIATLTLPGVVADDVQGGGIEVLLAGPLPRRDLFLSYLAAGCVLAAVSWLAATLAFAATTAASLIVTSTVVDVTLPFVLALIVLPLSLGLWSSAVTLFGALFHPRSLESRAGMNGGPIRLLAIAPSLLGLPAIVLLPDLALPALGAMFLGALAASLLTVHLIARGFRSTRILGS